MRLLFLIVALVLGSTVVQADQKSPIVGSTFKRPSAGALILLLPPIADSA